MPVVGKILKFDFATSTGFAHGDPEELRPTFGHHLFCSTGNDLGEHLGAIEDWIAHVVDAVKPALIGYEQPSVFMKTTPLTIVKLCCYGPALEKICHRRRGRNIPVRQINPSQLKKFWTGKGNAKKPEMEAVAKACGFAVKVDDEADAIAGWYWLVKCYGTDDQKRRIDQMLYEVGMGRAQKAVF